MEFNARKTDRGDLGELVFGKDSKEFKPLPTFGPRADDQKFVGDLASGKVFKGLRHRYMCLSLSQSMGLRAPWID
jgi:hypothetical protein